uniref:Uncharacterized protein n=1 Tax=Oryza meridionalis TaxID=40149 RepID=A0A0E0E2L8_9ORYZ
MLPLWFRRAARRQAQSARQLGRCRSELESVDPVATVAQIAGEDAYGLISMVTERAEKVRRNKYE